MRASSPVAEHPYDDVYDRGVSGNAREMYGDMHAMNSSNWSQARARSLSRLRRQAQPSQMSVVETATTGEIVGAAFDAYKDTLREAQTTLRGILSDQEGTEYYISNDVDAGVANTAARTAIFKKSKKIVDSLWKESGYYRTARSDNAAVAVDSGKRSIAMLEAELDDIISAEKQIDRNLARLVEAPASTKAKSRASIDELDDIVKKLTKKMSKEHLASYGGKSKKKAAAIAIRAAHGRYIRKVAIGRELGRTRDMVLAGGVTTRMTAAKRATMSADEITAHRLAGGALRAQRARAKKSAAKKE